MKSIPISEELTKGIELLTLEQAGEVARICTILMMFGFGYDPTPEILIVENSSDLRSVRIYFCGPEGGKAMGHFEIFPTNEEGGEEEIRPVIMEVYGSERREYALGDKTISDDLLKIARKE